MSRILLAWELGGNWGHLTKQLLLARALRKRGHSCLFAVRDVAVARDLLANEEFEFVQAPFYSTPEGESQVLASYPDILHVNGYSSPDLLMQLLKEWFSIFYKVKPDVVVTEFSPTAVLAAKLSSLPVLRIDTGFGCPPDELPFPSFRPWLELSAKQMLEKELRLLDNVNKVSLYLGKRRFSSLQRVLATDMDLLTTVPELDHYQGRRFGRFVGPLLNLYDGSEAEWPVVSGARVFVYLRPFDGLEVVLKVLSARPLAVIAVVPGIDRKLIDRYAGEHFYISTSPLRMSGILSGADVAVTHGGHGLASACLQSGIRMLLIPQVIEQLMTARNFERLGVGLGVNHEEVGARFAKALDRLLTEQGFRKSAASLASKYEDYNQELVIRNLVDSIEGEIRRRTVTSVISPGGYAVPLSCFQENRPTLLSFE